MKIFHNGPQLISDELLTFALCSQPFSILVLSAASFPAREFHPGVASLSYCFIAMSYLRL